MLRKILILLMLITFSCFVIADFSIDPHQSDLENISQGSTISTYILINNTANSTIGINFPQDLNLIGPQNYTISLSNDQNKTLTENQSRNYTLDLDLAEFMIAGSYAGDINITDSLNSSNVHSVILSIKQQHNLTIIGNLDFGEVFFNRSRSIDFKIKNNGNANLTGINLSIKDPVYDIKLDQNNISVLEPNKEYEITAEIKVPFEESPQKDKELGTLSVFSDQTGAVEKQFNIDTRSYLHINNVNIDIDGEDSNYEDEETVDEKLKPRSEVTIDVEVENLFEDEASEEIGIDDVKVKINVIDIDDGDDIELESDDKYLDYEGNDQERTFTLSFDVPDKAEDDTYEMEIIVTGTDDEDRDFETTWTINLEVERETHELAIDEFKLDPSTIGCDLETVAKIRIINFGREDEDYVRYTIKNSELGIDEVKSRFEIESDFENEDNIYEEDVRIDIDDAEPGTYTVEMRVYWDFDRIEEIQRQTLVIEDCDESSQENNQETPQTTPEPEEPQEETKKEEQEKPKEKRTEQDTQKRQIPKVDVADSGTLKGASSLKTDFRESDSYNFILLGANILFAILIVLIILLYNKK